MKTSHIFNLLAGLLILPLTSARRHGIRAEVPPTSPPACQDKTITVTIGASSSSPPELNPASSTNNQDGIVPISSASQTNNANESIISTIIGGNTVPDSATQVSMEVSSISVPPISATSNVQPLITSSITLQPQFCHHDNCFREMIVSSAIFGPFCNTYTYIGEPSIQTGVTPTNCPGLAARTSSACTCLSSLMAISASSSSTSYDATTTTRITSFVTTTRTVLSTLTEALITTGGAEEGEVTVGVPQVSETLSSDSGSTSTKAGGVNTRPQTAIAATSIQQPLNATNMSSTPIPMLILTSGTGTGTGQSSTRLTLSPKWTNTTYSRSSTVYEIATDLPETLNATATSSAFFATLSLTSGMGISYSQSATITNPTSLPSQASVSANGTTPIASPTKGTVIFSTKSLPSAMTSMNGTILTTRSASPTGSNSTSSRAGPVVVVTRTVTTSGSIATPSTRPSPSVVPMWGSLPASEGIKNCQKSEACRESADIFEICTNRIPNFANGTAAADCLCDPRNAWKPTTSTCLQCTQGFLPEKATTNSPPSSIFTGWTTGVQDLYCNATSGVPFSRNLDGLREVGQNTTAMFQSPIYLWNMNLLEEGVPEMEYPEDKPYTFPKKADSDWNTFPISKRSKKVFEDCLTGSVCQRAAANFKLCMTGTGTSDTWSCFCEPAKMFSDAERTLESGKPDSPFQTLAHECADCLAFGLPALNAEGYNADFFGVIVESIFQQGVCGKNSTSDKTAAKDNVMLSGARTTFLFQSPVLVYNFTLLEAEIPWVG